MDPVIVRNVRIGEGKPKICVPIVGTTRLEILEEAKKIKSLPADLVEWRADWYEDVKKEDEVLAVLRELRELLLELPILFTFRSAKEGGEQETSEEEYQRLCIAAVESTLADIVDVEVFSWEQAAYEIIACGKKRGVKILASNHDFQKTPEKKVLLERFNAMQELDTDILKIAVMPQCEKDVLVLLEATEEMVRCYAKKPVVSMAMSELGLLSRLSGEVFGSAITFGSAGKASAPGQISVCELKQILDIVSIEKKKVEKIPDIL